MQAHVAVVKMPFWASISEAGQLKGGQRLANAEASLIVGSSHPTDLLPITGNLCTKRAVSWSADAYM